MKIVEGGRLDRPNLCWICQRTPEIGSRVVDTEKYFDGFPHNLRGRMYVCEKCVIEMSKFFGFASDEAITRARYEADTATLILRGLKQRLDGIVHDLVHIAENPNSIIGDREAVELPAEVQEPEAESGNEVEGSPGGGVEGRRESPEVAPEPAEAEPKS